MTDYWVDDGGDDSSGTIAGKWTGAKVSIASLISAVPAALTTSGNRIFIGDDHIDSVTGAHRVFTGPTIGPPVILISADRTDNADVPAYKVGTGKQLRSDDGIYSLMLDGAFALYGIRMESGLETQFHGDVDEHIYLDRVTIVVNQGSQIVAGLGGTRVTYVDCVIDLSAEGSADVPNAVWQYHYGMQVHIRTTFIHASQRSTWIFDGQIGITETYCSGCDFSGFTAVGYIYVGGGLNSFHAVNCKTTASPSYAYTTHGAGYYAEFYNCGSDDDPQNLYFADHFGTVISSSAIYRTGGATVEGITTAWLVTTRSVCAEGSPLRSPWIYGTVETGSKTFDVYITNDTADFTNAQVWLEVEYLKDADEAQWFLADDHRATITTTAADQDDDSSTWNGSGPSFTYKQRLRVTATVGEAGQYRARVVVGLASIASSRFFYIDPKVVVS